MSERKVDTIDLGRGVKYAKVASRCAELHRDYDKCDIETTFEFKDGWAIFFATVRTAKGTFTGHSIGKVAGRDKQFEKQETIAVGRALAFAGYLASGEIASAEEMGDMRRLQNGDEISIGDAADAILGDELSDDEKQAIRQQELAEGYNG